MPAIQPQQLITLAEKLSQNFEQPEVFLHRLHLLLERYADRTRRSGQAGTLPVLITAYYVPKPVLQAIFQAITPAIQQKPKQALALCNILWKDRTLEARQLAITIFKHIPERQPAAILQQINEWLRDTQEQILITQILGDGLADLIHQAPEIFFQQVGNWLNTSDSATQTYGLTALIHAIGSPDFENLPRILNILAPMVEKTPQHLRPHLKSIGQNLAIHFPQEYAHWLKNLLGTGQYEDTKWIIRQTTENLPAKLRDELILTARGRTSSSK